jgi:ketosteroid isomerase-like protein
MTTRLQSPIVLLLVAIACAAPASQPDRLTPADEAAIRALHDEWSANAAANRFIDNLKYYADDAAELLPAPRVGMAAIRERWEGFLPDYEFTGADGTVREMGGTSEEAWVWAEFTNRYKLRGEPRIQHGNQLTILRKLDGQWKVHRTTWQSTAVPDTAATGGY